MFATLSPLDMKGYAAKERFFTYRADMSLHDKLQMSLTFDKLQKKYPLLSQELFDSIPLSKFIYFHLTQRKRILAVNMDSLEYCPVTERYRPPITKYDEDLNDHVALISERYIPALRHTFKSVLPGKYEILSRLKLIKISQEFDNFDFRCLKYNFAALPEYGKAIYITHDGWWYENNYLKNKNNWFTDMWGTTTVYELSDIYVAMEFQLGLELPQYNVLCEYIELKIVV
ncbi:unnamed protein product [Didymodactylos carnosus]|nr:unnamed protein product [Didymodactylos carnosus]CAF4284605.1 unnamed protein product [Didymodactylos carnosus]